MDIKEKEYAGKWKQYSKLIGFVVFMAILFHVFSSVTYLFRNESWEWRHVAGIKEEDLDMVYIGGSAAYLYWQPLKAWNDCGFTSYNFATASIPAESIKYYIKEVRKSQKPKLFVIGVRAFQYYSEEIDEAALRNGTDSMDIMSRYRYELINEYLKNRNMPERESILPYYFSIAKYHSNTENLGIQEAWDLWDNEGISINKGWEWIGEWTYLEKPGNFETQKRGELSPKAEEILVDLLEYCKEEKLQVLFVVCPYQITEEHQELYNTMEDIIQGYGFDFLNANLYYDEMGLDWGQDFNDQNHVNLFGAEKYTEFLEKFILESYYMPNHHGEEKYASWDIDYIRFMEEREAYAKTVTYSRREGERRLKIAEEMRKTNAISEWVSLVGEARYILLMTADGQVEWPQGTNDRRILEKWGFSENGVYGIRFISGNEILNDVTDESYLAEGNIGKILNHSYRLSMENDTSSIMLDGEEYSAREKGINVVVYDNYYGKVVGSAVICNDDENNLIVINEEP